MGPYLRPDVRLSSLGNVTFQAGSAPFDWTTSVLEDRDETAPDLVISDIDAWRSGLPWTEPGHDPDEFTSPVCRHIQAFGLRPCRRQPVAGDTGCDGNLRYGLHFLEWRAYRDVRGRSCRDLPINIEPFDPGHGKLKPWQQQTQRPSLLRGCGLYTYLLTPSARFSAAIVRAPLAL